MGIRVAEELVHPFLARSQHPEDQARQVADAVESRGWVVLGVHRRVEVAGTEARIPVHALRDGREVVVYVAAGPWEQERIDALLSWLRLVGASELGDCDVELFSELPPPQEVLDLLVAIRSQAGRAPALPPWAVRSIERERGLRPWVVLDSDDDAEPRGGGSSFPLWGLLALVIAGVVAAVVLRGGPWGRPSSDPAGGGGRSDAGLAAPPGGGVAAGVRLQELGQELAQVPDAAARAALGQRSQRFRARAQEDLARRLDGAPASLSAAQQAVARLAAPPALDDAADAGAYAALVLAASGATLRRAGARVVIDVDGVETEPLALGPAALVEPELLPLLGSLPRSPALRPARPAEPAEGRSPDVAAARRLAAEAALAMAGGNPGAAEAKLLEAVRRSPGDPAPLHALAGLYASQGRDREAAERYRAALAANAGLSPAWLGLSGVLLRGADGAGALQAACRAVETATDEAQLASAKQRLGPAITAAAAGTLVQP